MDPDFWHQRWQQKEIGFHEGDANQNLVKYFSVLSLTPGKRVFLPLCGKTRDIAWLLDKGYRVVGIELSELAIQELFSELDIEANVSTFGELKHFCAPNIDIYVGDFFSLTQDTLGVVDAIYDRAALVALPKPMRKRYASHLSKISLLSPQLLISFEYDQNLMDGPPFSVTQEEICEIYGAGYTVTLLSSELLEEGLKHLKVVKETVYLLEMQEIGN